VNNSRSAAIEAREVAALEVTEAVSRLGMSAQGLSAAVAADRLRENGENVLATHRVRAIAILWSQLRSPLLLLLMAAAAISGMTGDSTDALIIGAIILLSVVLGFVNEYRAEIAVEALHTRIRRVALVWRSGRPTRVDLTQLVVGDVVALQVLVLLGMIVIYLMLVEFAKSRFFAPLSRPQRPLTTERHGFESRVRRRAAPFVRHTILWRPVSRRP
jgi:magnesium-transporting ATPase (P-type)